MKLSNAFFVVVLASASVSHAQTPTSTPPPAGYDQPGPVRAADFVPPSLLTSPRHEVQELAYHDGLHLSYRLHSPAGIETVLGSQSLAVRIREIRAVAELQQMNKSKEFAKALVKAGEEKIDSVVGLVKDPVGTVKRLPQGASRFFGRVTGGLKNLDRDQSGGGDMAATLLGTRRKKAELALSLGVSAYSTNQTLQNELDLAARAMAGGALVVNVAGMALDGGAGAALSVIGINQTLQRALVESTPEELQLQNRETLIGLGVSPDTTERFLMNPWFSPWQETFVARAIKTLGIDPSPLIEQASQSLTEHDARYFVQVTRLFQRHHIDFTPLSTFQMENNILCALDQKGTLVVAVAADYIGWTPAVQQRAGEFLALLQPNGRVRAIALITDGAVSPRASEELARRGIVPSAKFLGPLE